MWLIDAMRRAALLLALASLATTPALAADPAAWIEEYAAIPVAKGGGPAAFDKVHVLKVGPRDAHRVLILVPGYAGGAGQFRELAADLTLAIDDLQVWALDRREQSLVDAKGLPLPGLDGAKAPYARTWGLALALDDLRQVVLAARDKARRSVVLGGHSWGATTALAYAAWDFGGKAGQQDLAGLLLIDGGVHGAFSGEGVTYSLTEATAATELKAIDQGSPFDNWLSDKIGLGHAPEAVAGLYRDAGRAALDTPTAPSSLAAGLPEALRPAGPVTNRALLGWLLDTHPPLPDLSLHSGRLTPEGTNPKDWVDDGMVPIDRVAASFAALMPAAWEAYWPRRLNLDLQAADIFDDTPVTRLLGLRMTHGKELTLPLFMFQTGLTHGSVLESARWVAGQSRIGWAAYEADEAMGHLDPLYAAADKNALIRSATAFMGTIAAPDRR